MNQGSSRRNFLAAGLTLPAVASSLAAACSGGIRPSTGRSSNESGLLTEVSFRRFRLSVPTVQKDCRTDAIVLLARRVRRGECGMHRTDIRSRRPVNSSLGRHYSTPYCQSES